jgi:hypothetical protein
MKPRNQFHQYGVQTGGGVLVLMGRRLPVVGEGLQQQGAAGACQAGNIDRLADADRCDLVCYGPALQVP